MSNNLSDEGEVVAIGVRTPWTRWAVLGGVCALVIGVYAWSANSGVIELSGLNAENTYYNLLVQGFRARQLNLKTEVPPGLALLADPYDPDASNLYRMAYGHPLHDLSYYKGKLYLYFGITPALVLFWPYTVLTGRYLLHKDAIVIFLSAGFLVGAGLLLAVWRRYFTGVKFWIIVPCMIALGLANFTPAILARCEVYEVAISCGYAMTMLALAGVWAALHQPQRRCRWLAAASLAYGLAVASRPSLLFGAIILLAPLVQAWREKRREWSLFLAAFVPIVLIGLGLMYYNALRFDNPLDFGQHYQLSATRQNTLEQFSLRYLWFNFQIAFLEPAHWSGYFPFVHDIAEPSLPKGAGEAEHPFGILTNIPLVWLVLAVPLAWRSRSAEDLSSLRWFLGVVALLFGICALTIGLYFTMCLRYEVEFTHELVLLAVIGILGLERVLAGQPAWRRVARCGWGLLLTFSVAFNLFASFNLRAEAHNNLGMVLEQKGGVDEAITQFREALKLDPACMLARNNLGIALGQKGRLDEAIIQFRKASELDPDSPIAYSNLGLALEQKGRLDEAITQFQNALQITPDQADIHFNLGNVLLQRRRLDEAITQFQNALLIKPDIAKAQNNLGDALLQKGNMGEAMIHFQKALQLEPSDPGFQYNLAWLLAVCPEVSLRNGNKAVELARQANTLTGGKNPIVLHILAASFAEAGQFSDALETAQSALPLAEMQSNTMLARQLQFEMKLYRASSPYHLPAQKH